MMNPCRFYEKCEPLASWVGIRGNFWASYMTNSFPTKTHSMELVK